MSNGGKEMLALDNVRAGYGESVILEDVSLSLNEGDTLALLGRNGVGKSTLLLTMLGLTQMHGGAVRWRGADITGMSTYPRDHEGVRWVRQERHMVASLTVEEHVRVG